MAPENNHSALHLLKINMTTPFTAETPPLNGACPISNLPTEIMGAIVTHLGQGSDVTSLARVSSRFLTIASPIIWKSADSDILGITTRNAQIYALGIKDFQYRPGSQKQDQRLAKLSFPLLKRLRVTGAEPETIVIIDQFLNRWIESITIKDCRTNNFFGKLEATTSLTHVDLQNWLPDLTPSALNKALSSMRHVHTVKLGPSIATVVSPATILILSRAPKLVHLAIERPYQITITGLGQLLYINSTPFNQLLELCVGVESEALSLLMPKLRKLTRASFALTSDPSAAILSLANAMSLRKIKLIFPDIMRFNSGIFDHLAVPAAEDFTLLVKDGHDLVWNTFTIVRMRKMFSLMPNLKALRLEIAGAPQINGADLLSLVGYTLLDLQRLSMPSLRSIDMDDLQRERQLVFPNVKYLHLGRLVSPMVRPRSMNPDIKRFWLEVNSRTILVRFPNVKRFRVDEKDELNRGVKKIIDYHVLQY